MSDNGGLLSVATADVVEYHPSESKCLFDGMEHTCNAVDEMKELCHVVANDKQLDGQTNGCNGLESPGNCYTDSGISNSADMDICSMELLDDSETNDEGCTVYEENETCSARHVETVSMSGHIDERDDVSAGNVADISCSKSKVNGDDTPVVNENLPGDTCNVNLYDDNANGDTSCANDSDVVGVIKNDNVLAVKSFDDSMQSCQQSPECTGDDKGHDAKADDSISCGDAFKVSCLGADGDVEGCPSSTEADKFAAVENLAADKVASEGGVEVVVFTSPATIQSQSQPTFTTSRSGLRPSRQSRPRMGSYGSPPPTAAAPSSSSPDDDPSKQQYVVNVHVNPGETFSVCVSDQVQLIQGNVRAFFNM